MNIKEQIKQYIASQPEPKRSDMQELHQHTSTNTYSYSEKEMEMLFLVRGI